MPPVAVASFICSLADALEVPTARFPFGIETLPEPSKLVTRRESVTS